MFVDVRRLVRYKVLTDASGEVASSFANVTGITISTKKLINYPRSEALSHKITLKKCPTLKVEKANLMLAHHYLLRNWNHTNFCARISLTDKTG